ncbi:MAG: hypothetical protein NWF04_02735 [Candidatus Bathyarchaeota archaeon]|nr:hypothetical protein [Candidatus Bathyarchaeota archaeon]
MKVTCACCRQTFNVCTENFSNYEIIFCPNCALDHQITKNNNQVTVKPLLRA